MSDSRIKLKVAGIDVEGEVDDLRRLFHGLRGDVPPPAPVAPAEPEASQPRPAPPPRQAVPRTAAAAPKPPEVDASELQGLTGHLGWDRPELRMKAAMYVAQQLANTHPQANRPNVVPTYQNARALAAETMRPDLRRELGFDKLPAVEGLHTKTIQAACGWINRNGFMVGLWSGALLCRTLAVAHKTPTRYVAMPLLAASLVEDREVGVELRLKLVERIYSEWAQKIPKKVVTLFTTGGTNQQTRTFLEFIKRLADGPTDSDILMQWLGFDRHGLGARLGAVARTARWLGVAPERLFELEYNARGAEGPAFYIRMSPALEERLTTAN